MTTDMNWLKRNPLAAYFLITYAISWSIWSPIVASAQGWVNWNVPYGLYYLGSFGPLLAAFTGEHVGEPRLLICLYGPPLVHVDLKFVHLDALAERVEDPVLLWDRTGDVRRRLEATPARYPQPNLQWVEDRFWIWVHYAATKLARGELFESLNMIAYLRDRVLGPLALLEAAARPNGLRRIETLAPGRIPALRATLAGLDAAEVRRALEAAIACYRELRTSLAPPGLVRSAAERPAVAFLGEVADQSR